MRWFSYVPLCTEPQNGETKVCSFFAWFPVTVRGNNLIKNETRWLEKVVVKYKYILGMNYFYWKPIAFIDKN